MFYYVGYGYPKHTSFFRPKNCVSLIKIPLWSKNVKLVGVISEYVIFL